ncbi:glycine/sarcosine/betaine reductase component B subunit [Anaerovorax odorimutans]|uniref:Glycine/sarcosine/betaine reductase component B subunit n=1 Tax=Anaerovorax odorimutans TaxID=109327 RepID=A0ABT1RMP3_9FIRM|nr:glycine/sarcosine/betaine reductase component B subunit [Anaerovorax odorimutans]MCQ4636460.1 glycine/sarcosine/betaine reductase component B subunit [Anaerovorax odorimutans]
MNGLKLELEIVEIKDIAFDSTTAVRDHILYIDKEELINYLDDPRLQNMEVDLARPGESVRIIPVKDVIEPRIKDDGTGGSFPGFLGGYEGVGDGKTIVLRGCSVITTGKIVGFQEGIIDMSGPAARHCEFSELNNVVVKADPADGIEPSEHEAAIREAGLKAAHFLAKAGIGAGFDSVETYQLPEVSAELPRVAIMYMTIAQGLLHDNYVYGIDAKMLHPTLLHPNELLDGVLVNGTCVVAADKQTTYRHQNNALVRELYARHGVDLNFAGVIVVPVRPELKEKKRCCNGAVNLARTIRADGVIIPEEGGGNPEADLMMTCRACEKHGIKTVLIIALEDPLTDTTPEADAVIDVGNDDEVLTLPPVKKVLGYEEQVQLLSGAPENCIGDDGTIQVPLYVITGLHGSLIGSHVRGEVY